MNTNEDIANNAISVYGADDASLNDFPVLKAFQQYIDAEQTKARKRMLWLSVFFGALMIAVVTVFVLLLMGVSRRNQALNDKLVEFAMQERDRQVEAAKETARQSVEQSARKAESDAAFKALADALSSIQRQISEQNAHQTDLAKRVAERPEGPSADQIALQEKLKADTEKLKRATALLQSEKAKLAAQKEALRQQEIEAQRRRLYPEYYSREEAAAAAKPKPKTKAKPKATPQTLEELEPIDYFAEYEDEEEEMDTADEELKEMMKALPKRPVKHTSPTRATPKKTDHYGVPLTVNGESANWLVPAK